MGFFRQTFFLNVLCVNYNFANVLNICNEQAFENITFNRNTF